MEQDQILSEGTYMANCSDQSLKFEIQAGVRDSDDIKLGDITSKYEVFFNEKNELVMKYDDVFKPVSGSSNTQNTVSICTKN